MDEKSFWVVLLIVFLFLANAHASGKEILTIQSRFNVVEVTEKNIRREIQKCVPEIDRNAVTVSNIKAVLENSSIHRFRHSNLSNMFVVYKTSGVCLEKSAANYPVFAAEEFWETVNPGGVAPDVLDLWYKKIALQIANKGTATVVYTFGNGNAFIARYWADGESGFKLFYTSDFRKKGAWEKEKIDLKFYDPTMTGVSSVARNDENKKNFPLHHKVK